MLRNGEFIEFFIFLLFWELSYRLFLDIIINKMIVLMGWIVIVGDYVNI
jgi:hypothetical protein